jgi:hypothetical protein
MFPTYPHPHEVTVLDRRTRFEATARKHRLLGLRHRRRPAA